MLTRLLLAAVWLCLGVATAWAPRSLVLYLADRLGATEPAAGALTWGLIGLEMGMGLGLILSVAVRWLRPLALFSLLLSGAFLALVLLDENLRACSCFGVLAARDFLPRLVILCVVLYLSALAAWPKPPRLPTGTTKGFRDVIRRGPGPGPDLAAPSGPGTIARSPETASTPGGDLSRPRGREHTPR